MERMQLPTRFQLMMPDIPGKLSHSTVHAHTHAVQPSDASLKLRQDNRHKTTDPNVLHPITQRHYPASVRGRVA